MEPKRRRRRVRPAEAAELTQATTPPTSAISPAVEPGTVAETSPVHDEPWAVAATEGDAPISERGLRGLVGGGSSQVSPTVALRARDASRPRAEDIRRAEADLTVVRRNWTPRD